MDQTILLYSSDGYWDSVDREQYATSIEGIQQLAIAHNNEFGHVVDPNSFKAERGNKLSFTYIDADGLPHHGSCHYFELDAVPVPSKRAISGLRAVPLDPEDDVMPIDEFIKCVEQGGFTDYDGFGSYSDGVYEYPDESFEASDVLDKKHRKDWTHVVWFNK